MRSAIRAVKAHARTPTKRLWAIYLIAGASLTIAYVVTHVSMLFSIVGLSSAIAIVLGVHLNRPANRLPWLLFAAGQGLFAFGDIVTYNYPAIFGTEIPFPSWGDPLYLLVYPCLVAGLLLVVRSRLPGRDVGSLIDSLIIAIGAGTVSWVALLAPIAGASDSSLDQKVVAMAYPVLDLVLACVVVRLLVVAGQRSPSLKLIACAALALLVADSAYSYISVQGIVYDHSAQLELGWAAFYLLWGAAALHPSMSRLTQKAQGTEQPLTTRRLIILAGATLLAEAVHAAADAGDGGVSEPGLYVVSGVMFVLVLVRLAGLVQQEERSARRERGLREAGALLVAATDRDAVYRATLTGARSLAGRDASLGILSWTEASGSLEVVAIDGPMPDALTDLLPSTEAARDRFVREGTQTRALGQPGAGGPKGNTAVAMLIPLIVRGEFRSLLVVTSANRPAADVAGSLETLAAQATLALESTELAEVLEKRRSQQWFASLVQNASDVILVIEPTTLIRFVSPACQRVLGYTPEQLIGRPLEELLQADELPTFHAQLAAVLRARDAVGETLEFRIRHADGAMLDVETQPSNLLDDPAVNGIVLNVRDVSERKAFEAQLAHQAFYDSLTGLANRALFQNRVEHALERRGHERAMPSILFIDLDDFKTVNDSLGHAAGDRLLTSVARRLQECLRASDTAARLGGDEFAVLMEDSTADPTEVAARLLAALVDPFDLDGSRVHVRASIGVATSTAGSRGSDAVASLLRNADVAMYSAKSDGGGKWRAFEAVMHDAARRRLELKSALDHALDGNELILNYQPIVDLETGVVRGVEALVRWMHPELGLIPPLDFIPLAEETGQIIPIGDWILREACRGVLKLQRDGRTEPGLYVAVNLSGRQMQRPEIVAEVREALRETGLPASDLVLEITESVLMADTEVTVQRLQALRDLGLRLAIDDFGTGYSSLNYLRQFPVDIVKIDRSFVGGVGTGGDGRALVALIIGLATALDLGVVAEGIEQADQLDALRSLGCVNGQGYLFGRPASLDDLIASMASPAFKAAA